MFSEKFSSTENDSSRILKRWTKSENALAKMTKARLENDEKKKKKLCF